ncbi:MAG: MBL fold metallo-hydrolase [Treponema sp.]|jgi:L-ascorbate metabolism protein UlaG (beta-lactamase superfamily)|nr:MBL fold metallo-hydrolase [Treponema sp.]
MERLRGWYKQGRPLLEEIEGSRPGEGEAWLWYLGQHGFVVNLGGLVFYIDVILNDLRDKEGRSRREYPAPFAPGLVRRVDYVLCTHNHADHLNLETLVPLAEANPKARFVVPRPWRRLLIEAGIGEDRILGAGDGEELGLGPVSILPVIAIHTRFIRDEPERAENGDSLCLGYILKAKGLRVYHAGDTWVTPLLIRTLRAASPLDVAILPINGTDWERTDTDYIGNMGALDAVKLARAVPADLSIPAHYDMMAANSENPALFADYLYRLCPEKRFHIFALGERFIYRK